jgi:rubrerythrin
MADQTRKNLEEAFAGESKANRRYLAYARKAEQEGFPNIARLFRAIAESETIHAHNHLDVLGAVGSTKENLQEAWRGEKDEYNSMYPMFINQAERDENSQAMTTFFWAQEAEIVHADFYDKAFQALQESRDVNLQEMHICTVCGYTVEGEPPGECPICGKGKEMFKAVR